MASWSPVFIHSFCCFVVGTGGSLCECLIWRQQMGDAANQDVWGKRESNEMEIKISFYKKKMVEGKDKYIPPVAF